MTILHLDFETRSACDLGACGADVYSCHPTTSVLCAAYAFDNGPVKLWKGYGGLPRDLTEALENPKVEIHAYNATFEALILNNVLHFDIPAHRFRCVMAMSYAMSLPGQLGNVASVMQLSQQKDDNGRRTMLYLSQPKTLNPLTWNEEPEEFETLYKYCIQDVETEREVEKNLLPLSTYEQKVWELDYAINRRGCKVDKKAVEAAIKIVEAEKIRLDNAMRELTDGAVDGCSKIQQIKDWLELYGLNAPELNKPALLSLLAQDLDPKVREVLELRQEAGKAATSKFKPMIVSASEDGRVKGCYQYSGANTRRFAGRRIQLHNLQRQKRIPEEIEAAINEIKAGATVEDIELLFGKPLTFMGELTRSFLTAAKGKTLLTYDEAAIEARVLAWLAGDENTLNEFRKGSDIYKVDASVIFGIPAKDINGDQRQVGKVANLALGFGGGVGAFQTMARTFGVSMAPVYKYLFEKASPERRQQAIDMFKQPEKKLEISREEFLASEITKLNWREAHPEIVNFWHALEGAAIEAVRQPGTIFAVGNKIKYLKKGSFLFCQLPGSGVLSYPFPSIKEVKTPWKTTRSQLHYYAEDGQTKKWMEFSTYGGSLAENVTQATARDILVDSMLRLDEENFSIVLHTHDEIVCEETNDSRMKRMAEIMSSPPKWAVDLPLAVKGHSSFRYCK